MPDYKEMYFTMVRETEKAIHILIQAQQKSEEMYIEDDEAETVPDSEHESAPPEQ